MEYGTGALGALLPKLAMLLRDEYRLQKSVKGGIKYLMTELESMQAALEKVSSVPAEQLDKSVRLWARDVREMSYEIEDSVDTFLVRVEGKQPAKPHGIKGFIDRTINSLAKVKIRHKIAADIEGIKSLVSEAKERRDRYSIDNVVVKHVPASLDPRLAALYKNVTELVGINEKRDELIKMLSRGDEVSNKKLRIVSVVGLGGLGKTTLAKIVYDKLKVQFKCWAFVSVGQDPDMKKILKDILLELDKQKYENIHDATRDEKQLIDILHKFLAKKRYFIVIDDIWDMHSWETIKLALTDNNIGSRVITTTRKFEVAKGSGDDYTLQPLSYENSRKLFYTRIFGAESKYLDNQPDEVAGKILKRCGGVPLAIITMASLLAGKSREEWFEVYRSIGFSSKDNRQSENTMRVLSFSYYDMPSHLRTCLLYLNMFPEDCIIFKNNLIWKWIAEGFVHGEQGVGLFELGERYFNELLNRSMIQPVEDPKYDLVVRCRLHDMVFGLIRSLSCEENFITVLDDMHDTIAQSNARRFSHQNRMIEHNPQTQTVGSHVRSFVACLCDIGMMVPLPTLQLLRVLALEECLFIDGNHLMCLRDLLHLRYLGLDGTPINELPKEIRSLKFLQTLSLERTGIEQLPLSIGMLTQLMCLRGDSRMRTPADGIIGNLTSLEELRMYPGTANNNKESTKQFLRELGSLKELRVLHIDIGVMDDSLEEALLGSLCNLPKLRYLRVYGSSLGKPWKWDSPDFMHPLHLRHMLLADFSLSRLPMWINCSLLPYLTFLSVDVESMDYRDMRILGRLPELRCLHVYTGTTFVVYGGDGYFPKLRFCRLITGVTAMFRGDKSGAPVMPSLEELEFHVHVRWSKDFCVHHGQGISLLPEVIGLLIIPSLQEVGITVNCENATPEEVDEAEEALRHAADSHPNHPKLELRRYKEATEMTSDEDIQGVDCRDVIDYHVHVRELTDIGYGFDFTNLWNLPLLQKVIAHINCEDATPSEVEEAVAAMRHAVEAHPNHPTLEVERHCDDKMKVSCDPDQQPSDDDITMEDEEA